MEDRTGGWGPIQVGLVRRPRAPDAGGGSGFGCQFWAEHLLSVSLNKLRNLSQPQLHL